jgi:ATP-dependent helicase/nuclease subunit A
VSGTRVGAAGALPDAAARERASDPRESIVLQAPAGSGKTAVLTQRMLRLLAEVEEPEQILAITFTRRAAAEMRERVLQALAGEVGEGTLARQLGALAERVLARSEARGWRLREDPTRLRIQTIDAFNLALANRLPLAARSGGPLTLGERPEALYRRAARETLVRAEQDPELAADVGLWFERLDNRWDNVERVLAEMLRERAHWLAHVLGSAPQHLSARVEESLGRIVAERLAGVCAALDAPLQAALESLPTVGALGADPASLPAWQRLAALCLTRQGQWRRSVDRRLGVEFTERAAKTALLECIGRLAALPGAQVRLLEVAALPPPRLPVDDATALAALSRLLHIAAAELEIVFAAAGVVDYTRIAGAAQAALSEAGEPSDLALRLGVQLRHILVDEFQDTSAAQTQLLAKLTAGWEPGDGRTLFVVGDPMQSIYMFRAAEVGCFLAVRDRGIGPLRLTPLHLQRNFRSAPALVKWCNATFGQLFPRADDVRDSAVSFSPSTAALQGGHSDTAVELRLFSAEDPGAEIAAVVERIAALKGVDPQASIAVLVAARRHAAHLSTALQARAVEAIGVHLVPLQALAVVRDLVALTRALCHLGDRTAWLALLRAPWCGASLATLTHLSARRDDQLPWEALHDAERSGRLAPAERARVQRVCAVLAESLAGRAGVPLADWLEQTWLRLGGPDAYPRAQLCHARAYFTAVSERAGAIEREGIGALDELLNGLHAEPRARSEQAVQILTIHHAKGLEFDHVLIPGLGRRGNHDREPLLRWLDLPRSEAGGSDLLLAPAPPVGAEDPRGVGALIKRLHEQRAAHEQLRLLYVAATRARRSLHLYATLKPSREGGMVRPTRGTPLARLWPVLGSDFLATLEADTPPLRDASGDLPRAGGMRLREPWQPPSLPAAAVLAHLPLGGESLEPPQFSWVQQTARHVGTLVHAQLQRWAESEAMPEPAAVADHTAEYAARLRRHGVPEHELEAATRRVLAALAGTLEDPRGRWILARTHREARSELALTGLADGRLRSVVIDRSFVDERGVRWVIDFKTSEHEGGRGEDFIDREVQRYRAQLAVYAALARELGPEPVRAGLYFPLLRVFTEV